MTDARTDKGWIAWLWLLIVTIGVHALVPVGSPLVRSSGSPFSATTVDVSTAPSRRQVQVEREEHDGRLDAAANALDGPGAAALPAGIPALAAPLPVPQAAIPRQRAAPALSSAAGPPRARAPPIS